jgi:hypothetical protein
LADVGVRWNAKVLKKIELAAIDTATFWAEDIWGSELIESSVIGVKSGRNRGDLFCEAK